ncbi:MAG: signal peptidase II [Myxococcota bacterium]
MLLGVVFVAWLVGDLWTKHWADTSLADPRHPLPATAGEADEGRPVGELVAERLDLPNPSDVEGRLTILPDPVPMEVDDPMYGPDSPAPRARAFYVAWRGEGLPPRRITRNERRLLVRWMTLAAPDAPARDVREVIDEHLAGLTVRQWLEHHLRRLSDDEAARVAEAGMHPIRGNPPSLDPSAKAVAGTTYLLEWRRVDVMGDWFKFVYAENPGAAFGFLKGVPHGMRDGIFLTLTVIVFLVILGVLVRIPPHHRVVPVALTGVLAGAVGNFVDRIRYGYVIDFLDMDLGFMHWPTYNVADIAISVGVVVLMLDITFNKKSPLVAQEDDGVRPAEA